MRFTPQSTRFAKNRFARIRETMERESARADTTVTSGTLYLSGVELFEGDVIERISYFSSSTLAPTGASHLIFGLYDRCETVLDQNARSFTATASTDTLDLGSAHGWSNGDTVTVKSITGAAGLTIETTYFVVGKTANTIQLSATAGGAAINITTDGTVGLIRAAQYGLLASTADLGAFSWTAADWKTVDVSAAYKVVYHGWYYLGILMVASGGTLQIRGGGTYPAKHMYGGGHDGDNGGTAGSPIGMKAHTIIHNATGLTALPSIVIPDNASAARNTLLWAACGDYYAHA